MDQIQSLTARLNDPESIVRHARRITQADIEDQAPWIRADIACGAAIVFLGAAKEGWEPWFYTWPDFTTGYFIHEPSEAELVAAYAEWRSALELEIAAPEGSA